MCPWSQPTTAAIAFARAGGRRRINAERHMAATLCKRKVWHWYQRWADVPGVRGLLAHTFDLHPSTIARYLKDLQQYPLDPMGPMHADQHPRVGRARVMEKRPVKSPRSEAIAADRMG